MALIYSRRRRAADLWRQEQCLITSSQSASEVIFSRKELHNATVQSVSRLRGGNIWDSYCCYFLRKRNVRIAYSVDKSDVGIVCCKFHIVNSNNKTLLGNALLSGVKKVEQEFMFVCAKIIKWIYNGEVECVSTWLSTNFSDWNYSTDFD